jgi:uncharacterized protein
MSNRLSESNSPYLIQHADNPVDWYPWGEEALEKARQEDKPIFLSIGYAACHWCHVMAHESFEDPETARLMNEHFVNIKVDREERPDLDSIYINAVVALTGQGGWPMSVFLTPEGRPFYGGTYFPPVPRYNMPSFRDVLINLARLWKEDRERLLKAGDELTGHLQASYSTPRGGKPLADETLQQASLALAQSYDWQHGGWGKAPKFPQPMAIEFLLVRAARGDKFALDIATHALHAMAKGGMYDVVGGGFARYSTDDKWLVPHFEKMLYDNAQLALAYLHGFLLTGDEAFRRVCEETLDFILRELTGPEGGFYSSLDADSEGEEGKFYLWSPEEIRAVLNDSQDYDFVATAYGITEAGNFEGRNILQRALDDEELASRFGLPVREVPLRLSQLHDRLLEVRGLRVRPGTDDKALASWNALALSAFSQAGRYLYLSDYTEVAMRNARFLISELRPAGRLLRSWRAGKAQQPAFLEDYAALILGLLDLYQSDPNSLWFSTAVGLAEEMVAHFQDPSGGFYDTRDDHQTPVARPKDIQDNATPSGNSLAANALLRLAAYTARGDWRDLAENMLVPLQEAGSRYPTAFSVWLCAIDFAIGPTFEVAILGEIEDPGKRQLVDALWSAYRPHLVAAVSPFPPPVGSPPLLEDRPLLDGRPTAYVCRDFICHRPVNRPEDMISLLNQGPGNQSD